VDRRVRRTRRSLTDALVGLILERGYDRVTVQDVLDRADVGRSTFYAHFRDKEALLLSCFDGLRDDLRGQLDPGPAGGLPAQVLFEHAHRNRRVYRALCGRRGGAVVHGHLHALVSATLLAQFAPPRAAATPPTPPDVVAEFCTSALLGLLFWWVDAGFPHPPAEMAAAYDRMAAPAVRAALEPAELSAPRGTLRP
jgi:AcrR family transcriptional regulator